MFHHDDAKQYVDVYKAPNATGEVCKIKKSKKTKSVDE